MGLLPHVLHHIGLLAGTALVAGPGGTALFGALGLRASIPMLVRRFGSWMAPALGIAVVFVYAAILCWVGVVVTGGTMATIVLASFAMLVTLGAVASFLYWQKSIFRSDQD